MRAMADAGIRIRLREGDQSGTCQCLVVPHGDSLPNHEGARGTQLSLVRLALPHTSSTSARCAFWRKWGVEIGKGIAAGVDSRRICGSQFSSYATDRDYAGMRNPVNLLRGGWKMTIELLVKTWTLGSVVRDVIT